GASSSKARGLWPFTSAAGGGGSEAAGAEQALVRPRGRVEPHFVFNRRAFQTIYYKSYFSLKNS
uniref:Uncharacterized protein n=1 Tax=Aotus nancymaae TaxID=37293 RepID=A0A2K5C206_AOTNA